MLRRRACLLHLGVLWTAACAAPAPPAPPLPPQIAPAPRAPVVAAASAAPPAHAAPEGTSDPEPSPPPPPASKPADEPRKPHLTSQGYVTWIYGRPKVDERYIGYIRHGSSVALRSTEIVRGQGCGGGFLAIEPRGYVCRDQTVTLDPSPRFLAGADATRATSGAYPYRYAISNGAPMYNRVPTAAEQKRFENKFGPAGKWIPLPKTLSAHEDLAVPEAIAPSDAIPSFLENGGLAAEGRFGLERQIIPLGSMLSFTKSFAAEGRTWLLSVDQTVVPADRVRPFKPSAFRGVHLGGEVTLPIAWMRKTPKPRYHRRADGALEPTGDMWPVRTHARLTGAKVDSGGATYLETKERGADGQPLYVAEADATVVEAREKPPSGVAVDQKYIIVSITQGTLVAYDGPKPVYTTLMSPGAGGVPVKGQDLVKASTTPTGTYYVTFKDRAATMSPEKGDNRSFWIADVPWTQYFNPPFALHAAYWHERFGEPTSAGCINVSPVDAEILFNWSDPPVPEAWQGATGAGAKENGPTTAIVVRR